MKNIWYMIPFLIVSIFSVIVQKPLSASELRIVTISSAVKAALDNNLSIKTDSLEILIKTGNSKQLGLPENPEVILDADGFAQQTSGSPMSTSITLEQSFQPAARLKQKAVGKSEIDIALTNLEKRQLDLQLETKRRFIAALALQKQKILSDSLMNFSRGIHQIAVNQALAGKVSIADTLKTGAEFYLLQIQHDKIAQRYQQACQELAAMWGSSAIDFICQGSELDSIKPYSGTDSVYSRNLSDIKIAAAELQSVQSQLALEKALRIPAVRIGAGVGIEEKVLTPRASLALSIPLLNRNQGAIEAAKVRVRQARFTLDATKMQAQNDYINLCREELLTFGALQILNKNILPQLRENLEASYNAFLSGKTGVGSLIDAQQRLYEVSQMSIETSRDLLLTHIELDKFSVSIKQTSKKE